jgi:vacuolar-type H+-ATPase subunit I/STV1
MSETTATIIVAVVTALGSVITALIGWLARKGVNFMDQKTKVLDEASELQRKEAIKNKIVDTVTLVARATMQTYVDEVKTRNADGKLTKEEAAEAFRRTVDQSLDLLKREGIEVGKDVLGVVVEAVVGKLKVEKNGSRGEAKAAA